MRMWAGSSIREIETGFLYPATSRWALRQVLCLTCKSRLVPGKIFFVDIFSISLFTWFVYFFFLYFFYLSSDLVDDPFSAFYPPRQTVASSKSKCQNTDLQNQSYFKRSQKYNSAFSTRVSDISLDYSLSVGCRFRDFHLGEFGFQKKEREGKKNWCFDRISVQKILRNMFLWGNNESSDNFIRKEKELLVE